MSQKQPISGVSKQLLRLYLWFYWEFNGTASKLKIGAVSLIYSKSVVNRYLAYFDGHHAPHPEVIKIWRFH
jgi:hypothetical protein